MCQYSESTLGTSSEQSKHIGSGKRLLAFFLWLVSPTTRETEYPYSVVEKKKRIHVIFRHTDLGIQLSLIKPLEKLCTNK